MNNTDLEKSVKLVVEDLKKKIDEMEEAAANADSQKAIEIKDKAVEVLTRVSNKFVQTANNVRTSKEFNDGVTFVLTKSKDLYETTMKKIEEVAKKPEVTEALKKANETIDTKIEEIKKSPVIENAVNDLGSLFENVKKNVDDFASREEVKAKVDETKRATIEIAEKGLAIIKDWLSPKGEDE